MHEIRDEVTVDASPAEAYRALTRQEGYNGWWSKNCEIGGEVGGTSTLRFDKGGTLVTMQFRTQALEEDARVRWECVANDAPPWVGTTLDWRIEPSGDFTRVSLTHGNWGREPPAEVAQGWKHFLGSLKQYLETGTGEPW